MSTKVRMLSLWFHVLPWTRQRAYDRLHELLVWQNMTSISEIMYQISHFMKMVPHCGLRSLLVGFKFDGKSPQLSRRCNPKLCFKSGHIAYTFLYFSCSQRRSLYITFRMVIRTKLCLFFYFLLSSIHHIVILGMCGLTVSFKTSRASGWSKINHAL